MQKVSDTFSLPAVTEPSRKKRIPYLPTLGVIGFVVVAIFSALSCTRLLTQG